MKPSNIYDFLDTCYDFNSQEKWDESGMISFGSFDEEVNKILVVLEITSDVINYAIKNGIKLIITHHPIFTKNLEDDLSINHQYVKTLYENKISVIAIHTPFDKDVSGMNVALAQKLQLRDIKRLNDSNKYVIMGNLYKPMRLDRFAKLAKDLLQSDYAKFVETFKNTMVKKIAICGGAGGSFINEVANNKNVDVYLTCDLKHHAWNDAYEKKLPVIELNHEIENIFIGVIAKKLVELNPSLVVIKYSAHMKKNIV